MRKKRRAESRAVKILHEQPATDALHEQPAADAQHELEVSDPPPSTSESSSSEDEVAMQQPEATATAADRLRQWKLRNVGITATACTEVLEIFRSYGVDVPKDCRTLMNTPRGIAVVSELHIWSLLH